MKIHTSIVTRFLGLLTFIFLSVSFGQSGIDTSNTFSSPRWIIMINMFSGRPNPFFWLNDVSLSDQDVVLKALRIGCNNQNPSPPKYPITVYTGLTVYLQKGQESLIPVARIRNKTVEFYKRNASVLCPQISDSNNSTTYLPDNNSELEKKLLLLALQRGTINEKMLAALMERINKEP